VSARGDPPADAVGALRGDVEDADGVDGVAMPGDPCRQAERQIETDERLVCAVPAGHEDVLVSVEDVLDQRSRHGQ